jgi:cytochrome c553
MNGKKGRASGLFSFLAILAPLLALPPAAARADEAAGRSLAATCANCHGTEGRALGADVPSLAGRPRAEIVALMKAFRDGSRPATVMHQLSRGYTERQVEDLAEFFAARK